MVGDTGCWDWFSKAQWICGHCHIIVLFCEGSGGISCFIVEKGSAGLSFGAKEEKVCCRNSWTPERPLLYPLNCANFASGWVELPAYLYGDPGQLCSPQRKPTWRRRPGPCIAWWWHKLTAVFSQGFQIAMRGLNGGRINIASCSLGGALQALVASTQYLKEREAFKQKLINFQVSWLVSRI